MKNYRLLLVLFWLTVLAGCHLFERSAFIKPFPEKKMAIKMKPLEKQNWKQIKNQKTASLKERLNKIDNFIKKHKGKEIVLSAYLLKAKILLRNKKREQACLIYHKIVDSDFDYNERWLAYRESAKCYFEKREIKPAVETLEKLIQNPKESLTNKRTAAQMQWSFLKNQKFFTGFKLMSLSHLSFFSSSPKQKELWFNTAKKLIDKLPFSDLVIYANQASFFSGVEPYLLYKAGQYFLTNKEFKKAEKYFKKSLSTPLSSSLRKEVKQTLSLMKKISQVNPYLIGVIAPLSGRRQTLGEKVLRGLYMGLALDQDSPWQILVLDSKSHPEVVRTHINDLFYRYHVMGLIGGLTGETAEVMAQKAEEFAIPTVILSQKRDITKDRKFVFQNAITAQQLLTPLIKEVRNSLKINKVAILYPNDSYGKDYSSLFSELFKEKGGKITAKEVYKPGEADFKNSIKSLLHLNIKDREKEFERLKAELLQQKTSVRSLKLKPENVLSAQKDFSAVFIPDSWDSLKKIKDHFRYFGVKNIYFFGTNLWQDIDIKTEDFSFLFVNLPKKENHLIKQSEFYKKFIKSYSYAPGQFEQRAYNTALFFRLALKKNVKSRFAFKKELESIKSFQGAYYNLSVSKSRVIQYPLNVYKFVSHKNP